MSRTLVLAVLCAGCTARPLGPFYEDARIGTDAATSGVAGAEVEPPSRCFRYDGARDVKDACLVDSNGHVYDAFGSALTVIPSGVRYGVYFTFWQLPDYDVTSTVGPDAYIKSYAAPVSVNEHPCCAESDGEKNRIDVTAELSDGLLVRIPADVPEPTQVSVNLRVPDDVVGFTVRFYVGCAL